MVWRIVPCRLNIHFCSLPVYAASLASLVVFVNMKNANLPNSCLIASVPSCLLMADKTDLMCSLRRLSSSPVKSFSTPLIRFLIAVPAFSAVRPPNFIISLYKQLLSSSISSGLSALAGNRSIRLMSSCSEILNPILCNSSSDTKNGFKKNGNAPRCSGFNLIPFALSV